MAEQSALAEVKKYVETKHAILGTQRTLKALKKGTLKKIFLSKNCPDSVRKDTDYYATMGNVDVSTLEQPNDELGNLLKKPFSISVIGISK